MLLQSLTNNNTMNSPYIPTYPLQNNQHSTFNIPSNVPNMTNNQQRDLFPSTISPITIKSKFPGNSFRKQMISSNNSMMNYSKTNDNIFQTPITGNLHSVVNGRSSNIYSNRNATGISAMNGRSSNMNSFSNNMQLLSNTSNNMLIQNKTQKRNGNRSQMFKNNDTRSSLHYLNTSSNMNMNISANAIGNGINGGNEISVNYECNTNVNNPRSIAVIGFPASDAANIHRKFVRYGNVFNIKHECNVLFIEYENEMSAKRALNESGSWITSGHQKYMIAVCFQEHTRNDMNRDFMSANQSSFVNQNSLVMSKMGQNFNDGRFVGFNYHGNVERHFVEDGGTFFRKLYNFLFSGW